MKNDYKNENDLLKLVLGHIPGKDIPEKCDKAILLLKKDIYINIRKLTIKIIKLLWSEGIFNIGKYLSGHKQIIIHLLYEMYEQPLTSIALTQKLSEINKYGIFIRILKNLKFPIQEYIYDFFDLLINENKIKVKKIINKYFNRIINRRISLNLSIDELINFINESNCFSNNKFELYKLYEYIDNKEKMDLSLKVKNQKIRKHNKNKKEKMNIEKNTDFIN